MGTRGSDLARWQTARVIEALLRHHPGCVVETVVIRTHGDTVTDQPLDSAGWPAGAFVGALERALVAGEIDAAVHSYKDLPTVGPEGLEIVAVPPRAAPHDALLTKVPIALDALPPAWRIGTSSPRRREQVRRVGRGCIIVPLRGNIPTRVEKLDGSEYDGIVVAAAALDRLGIVHPNRIDLPVERFVPAPAQGALAIQARSGSPAAALLAVLDDAPSRRRVTAERAVLRAVGATCRTPVAALATADGEELSLHAQLYSDDGRHLAEARSSGNEPDELGRRLGRRLRAILAGEPPCVCG